MRREMVILQDVSLNIDRFVDIEFTHWFELQCLGTKLFYLAKQTLLFWGGVGVGDGGEEIPEAKNSNFLLTKPRLESIYSACCAAFMSLWRTCLGGKNGWKPEK